MARKGESFASSVEVRERMRRQRRRDTTCELALRSELHRRGLRFFVHRRPIAGFRREADLVFPRDRLAVLVDGCFWHGCAEHGTIPKSNTDWWAQKLEATRSRDAETVRCLEEAGWTVVRVWEHEAVDEAVARVLEALVVSRQKGVSST